MIKSREEVNPGWLECSNLPDGWCWKEVVRRTGDKIDVYYNSPDGMKIRSKLELAKQLGDNYDLSTFDYKSGKFQSEIEEAPAYKRNSQTSTVPSKKNASVIGRLNTDTLQSALSFKTREIAELEGGIKECIEFLSAKKKMRKKKHFEHEKSRAARKQETNSELEGKLNTENSCRQNKPRPKMRDMWITKKSEARKEDIDTKKMLPKAKVNSIEKSTVSKERKSSDKKLTPGNEIKTKGYVNMQTSGDRVIPFPSEKDSIGNINGKNLKSVSQCELSVESDINISVEEINNAGRDRLKKEGNKSVFHYSKSSKTFKCKREKSHSKLENRIKTSPINEIEKNISDKQKIKDVDTSIVIKVTQSRKECDVKVLKPLRKKAPILNENKVGKKPKFEGFEGKLREQSEIISRSHKKSKTDNVGKQKMEIKTNSIMSPNVSVDPSLDSSLTVEQRNVCKNKTAVEEVEKNVFNHSEVIGLGEMEYHSKLNMGNTDDKCGNKKGETKDHLTKLKKGVVALSQILDQDRESQKGVNTPMLDFCKNEVDSNYDGKIKLGKPQKVEEKVTETRKIDNGLTKRNSKSPQLSLKTRKFDTSFTYPKLSVQDISVLQDAETESNKNKQVECSRSKDYIIESEKRNNDEKGKLSVEENKDADKNKRKFDECDSDFSLSSKDTKKTVIDLPLLQSPPKEDLLTSKEQIVSKIDTCNSVSDNMQSSLENSTDTVVPSLTTLSSQFSSGVSEVKSITISIASNDPTTFSKNGNQSSPEKQRGLQSRQSGLSCSTQLLSSNSPGSLEIVGKRSAPESCTNDAGFSLGDYKKHKPDTEEIVKNWSNHIPGIKELIIPCINDATKHSNNFKDDFVASEDDMEEGEIMSSPERSPNKDEHREEEKLKKLSYSGMSFAQMKEYRKKEKEKKELPNIKSVGVDPTNSAEHYCSPSIPMNNSAPGLRKEINDMVPVNGVGQQSSPDPHHINPSMLRTNGAQIVMCDNLGKDDLWNEEIVEKNARVDRTVHNKRTLEKRDERNNLESAIAVMGKQEGIKGVEYEKTRLELILDKFKRENFCLSLLDAEECNSVDCSRIHILEPQAALQYFQELYHQCNQDSRTERLLSFWKFHERKNNLLVCDIILKSILDMIKNDNLKIDTRELTNMLTFLKTYPEIYTVENKQGKFVIENLLEVFILIIMKEPEEERGIAVTFFEFAWSNLYQDSLRHGMVLQQNVLENICSLAERLHLYCNLCELVFFSSLSPTNWVHLTTVASLITHIEFPSENILGCECPRNEHTFESYVLLAKTMSRLMPFELAIIKEEVLKIEGSQLDQIRDFGVEVSTMAITNALSELVAESENGNENLAHDVEVGNWSDVASDLVKMENTKLEDIGEFVEDLYDVMDELDANEALAGFHNLKIELEKLNCSDVLKQFYCQLGLCLLLNFVTEEKFSLGTHLVRIIASTKIDLRTLKPFTSSKFASVFDDTFTPLSVPLIMLEVLHRSGCVDEAMNLLAKWEFLQSYPRVLQYNDNKNKMDLFEKLLTSVLNDYKIVLDENAIKICIRIYGILNLQNMDDWSLMELQEMTQRGQQIIVQMLNNKLKGEELWPLAKIIKGPLNVMTGEVARGALVRLVQSGMLQQATSLYSELLDTGTYQEQDVYASILNLQLKSYYTLEEIQIIIMDFLNELKTTQFKGEKDISIQICESKLPPSEVLLLKGVVETNYSALDNVYQVLNNLKIAMHSATEDSVPSIPGSQAFHYISKWND